MHWKCLQTSKQSALSSSCIPPLSHIAHDTDDQRVVMQASDDPTGRIRPNKVKEAGSCSAGSQNTERRMMDDPRTGRQHRNFWHEAEWGHGSPRERAGPRDHRELTWTGSEGGQAWPQSELGNDNRSSVQPKVSSSGEKTWLGVWPAGWMTRPLWRHFWSQLSPLATTLLGHLLPMCWLTLLREQTHIFQTQWIWKVSFLLVALSCPRVTANDWWSL